MEFLRTSIVYFGLPLLKLINKMKIGIISEWSATPAFPFENKATGDCNVILVYTNYERAIFVLVQYLQRVVPSATIGLSVMNTAQPLRL
jgi:hypothetical protein